MMQKTYIILLICLLVQSTLADNPLVTNIYTADPTARVFHDTLYIYPSHDVPEYDGRVGNNNFFMEDYHVFSTTDLMNYTDHGVILHQNDVDWVDNNSNAMWAPDCIEKDGQYYFYFPGNFRIGVAVADHPTGPFTPRQSPINNANHIDPCCFIDDDGTPYLYFGGGDNLLGMRMKDDMVTPDMSPVTIKNLPEKYKEGSFVFKRNDIYYFTFPHALSGSEELAYATGTNPLGPFDYQGKFMDRWTDNCWTNHHSIVEYKGQWYLFYHHHDLTGDGTLRSMCADKLFFNDDGTIQKVIPTRRGIGIRKAYEKIQVDRYNQASGCTDEKFLRFEPNGLYVTEIRKNGWLQYSDVDFEDKTYTSLSARVSCATTGGTIEVRTNSTSGDLLGTIDVPSTGKNTNWQTVSGTIAAQTAGLQDLYLVFKSNAASTNIYNVNWIRFNPENTFQLNFDGNGEGQVSIQGINTFSSDETSVLIDLESPKQFTFTATADDESNFDGWQLNGQAVEEINTVKKGDIITAIFSSTILGIDAFSRLEAEDFDDQHGIQSEDCSEGGQNIGYIENGDYIMYGSVIFGSGAESVSVRASSQTSGGTINFYLDDINSEPIAAIKVNNTGGWQIWKTFTTPITGAKGMHDLYIQFTGGSGYLLNLNWIEFTPSSSNVKSGQNTSVQDFKLAQNYPNPFNPRTIISYTLPQESKVDLAVYDILGKKVAQLQNSTCQAGEHHVEFDATHLNSGMYVYILTALNFRQSKKMMVLK